MVSLFQKSPLSRQSGDKRPVGVGRYIFRRKVLTAVLLFGFCVPSWADLAMRPQSRETGEEYTGLRALSPRQSHEGPAFFSLHVEPHELIDKYLRILEKRSGLEWLQTALDRGEPYRDYIVKQIEKYDMPRELLYLPVIESTNSIYARSRSGAVGLWQFMTNSMSPWMVRTEWLDQRRDFWISTKGALEKLAFNYKQTGDWFLALAAYNCGLTRLNTIMNTTGIRDFWALAEGGHLPSQTRDYVPKYLAISWFARYGGRNGLKVDWAPPMNWNRLELDAPVDLRILAEKSGTPFNLLKNGNAELNYPVTPPDFKYHLKVPERYETAIEKTLENNDLRLINVYIHTIDYGDTLYDLARHFDVSVSMILKYNPGTRAQTLRIGTHLVIPALSDVGPYQRQEEEVIDLSDVDIAAYYVVQKGDSLWGISQKFSTTPKVLAQFNGFGVNSTIQPGDSLKIPDVSSD